MSDLEMHGLKNGVPLKEIELKNDVSLKNSVNGVEIEDQETAMLLASSDSIHQSQELRQRTGKSFYLHSL